MNKRSSLLGAGVAGILLYFTLSLSLGRSQQGKRLHDLDHAAESDIVKNCVLAAVSCSFPLLCERLMVALSHTSKTKD